MTSSDLRLYWVDADPGTERAVDALGLGAEADKIADILLPGMSVQTPRARYLSFLCWAVKKADGDLRVIHRLEATLACEEAREHRWGDPSTCPNIVGRQRARSYLEEHDWKEPPRPEGLYKNMAFAAYRPLMKALRFLKDSGRPKLTDIGHEVAASFHKNRGPAPRCMNAISSRERLLIRRALGLDYRLTNRGSSATQRRLATYDELHKYFAKEVSAPDILESYSSRPRSVSSPAMHLHRAFAWENLSLGLAQTFALLLEDRNIARTAKRLRRALRANARWPGLSPDTDDADTRAEYAVAWIRRALKCDLEKLHLDSDSEPLVLAERLIANRDALSYVEALLARHQRVKGGDPWIDVVRGRLRPRSMKKNLDLRPRVRTYRLDAFGQMVRDLGMA